jgi:hypothetical protein
MRRADRQQYRQAAGAAAEARLMRQLIKTAALTLLPLVLAGYAQAAENAPKVPICVSVVAGCAAQTGVIPTGEGNYLVAKQAATGFPGLGNLKADALQEANQFCASKGSDLFVTRSSETQPPYVLANYSSTPRAKSATPSS